MSSLRRSQSEMSQRFNPSSSGGSLCDHAPNFLTNACHSLVGLVGVQDVLLSVDGEGAGMDICSSSSICAGEHLRNDDDAMDGDLLWQLTPDSLEMDHGDGKKTASSKTSADGSVVQAASGDDDDESDEDAGEPATVLRAPTLADSSKVACNAKAAGEIAYKGDGFFGCRKRAERTCEQCQCRDEEEVVKDPECDCFKKVKKRVCEECCSEKVSYQWQNFAACQRKCDKCDCKVEHGFEVCQQCCDEECKPAWIEGPL